MSHQECEENWKTILQLINNIASSENKQIDALIKQAIEQNVVLLNELFAASIENIKSLQNAKSMNEVICVQAKLTNEINKKISLSAQRFFNASLGPISDYNEWLKAHCDLATD